jgi:hypothetical protein
MEEIRDDNAEYDTDRVLGNENDEEESEEDSPDERDDDRVPSRRPTSRRVTSKQLTPNQEAKLALRTKIKELAAGISRHSDVDCFDTMF